MLWIDDALMILLIGAIVAERRSAISVLPGGRVRGDL
jgi:hypothetical protein